MAHTPFQRLTLAKMAKSIKTQVGNYPVEAVKFVDGKAMMKVAGEYVSMDKVSEYYEG